MKIVKTAIYATTLTLITLAAITGTAYRITGIDTPQVLDWINGYLS